MEKEFVKIIAFELLKLQLNYAGIKQYDDMNTIRITKECIDDHNYRLNELSKLLMDEIKINNKSKNN